MHLAYNGAPFCGWQRQPNAPSVQQRLEEALALVLRAPVPITGAGRTDTGVHARCMYAHFDWDQTLPQQLLRSLNHLCGKDIALYDIFPVSDDMHARFSATSRTYRYYVSMVKDPFLYPYSWFCPAPLDIEAMNRAAAVLIQTEDFTSFAKLHTDTKTNICHVTEARWEADARSAVFTITADRFLRNMVRAVVGTLVEVGRGKLSLPQFKDVIERRDRCAAGNSMPPQALFLERITYPGINC